jgi:hypothetical protein
MALLGLAVVFATALPQIGFAQSNPFNALIGTWKVNLAKSTFSPGPPPKSQSVTFQAVGQGLGVTAEAIDAHGNPLKVNFGVSLFDGQSIPVAGTPAYDASAGTRIDANTIILSRTKAGKLVEIATMVVSPDGKTRTLTVTGTDASGHQHNNIVFYDKQ